MCLKAVKDFPSSFVKGPKLSLPTRSGACMMHATAGAFNPFSTEENPLLNSPASRPRAGLPAWPAVVLLATLVTSCAQKPQTGATTEPTPQAAASPAAPVPWGTIEPPKQVSVPAGTPTAPKPRSPVRTFHGTGAVRSVNLAEGWFEIDHEEIDGYMPAMKMQWKVRDSSMLKPLSVGDKVDFTLEEDNGSELVTELKKARQP